MAFPGFIFGQANTKWSIEAQYGLNGNFFVRTYDEQGGPANKTFFYSKNFIGPIAGAELKFGLSKSSTLSFGYSRSVNKGEKNFFGQINGVDVAIEDFNIRHINDFFQLGYSRPFRKSIPAFSYHIGVVYLRAHQQEIMIENYDNLISIAERNFQNSKLAEAGFYGGFQFVKKIDSRFSAGIKTSVYYLASIGVFEAVTLTPTLSYSF